MDDEAAVDEKSAVRDWTSIREWTNLAVACGALLVAIVSVWTTAQISGIEDYFRSEIARRNSDLNSISDQARRLGSLADEREKRLADLQTTTEAITASNLAAQGKLFSTEEELSRLGLEVLGAKQTLATSESRLAALTSQSKQQTSQIDLFKRQRFFERLSMRVGLVGLWGDEVKDLNGESVYEMITTLPAGEVDADLGSYVPEFRTNAARTCQFIRDYNPTLPKQQSYPEAPPTPGKLTDNGTSRIMTDREYKDWLAARDQWFKNFGEISKANDAALKLFFKAQEYLGDAARSCICQALASETHSPGEICPGSEKAPQRPMLAVEK